jgi:hypothetical protein
MGRIQFNKAKAETETIADNIKEGRYEWRASMSNSKTYPVTDKIQDILFEVLQTYNESSRISQQILEKHKRNLDMSYEIYKDKYWQLP